MIKLDTCHPDEIKNVGIDGKAVSGVNISWGVIKNSRK